MIDQRRRGQLLRQARGMLRAMDVMKDGNNIQYALLEIAAAALDYGASNHTHDANCSAGDCDGCSAREALEKLKALVGGPS